VRTLKPGGRFAGDFFGPRNAWAGRPGMTFLTREQLTLLCQGLQIEHFVEEEGQRPTALEGVQAFHGYQIAVRKV
jgi:hypothetical protein